MKETKRSIFSSSIKKKKTFTNIFKKLFCMIGVGILSKKHLTASHSWRRFLVEAHLKIAS